MEQTIGYAEYRDYDYFPIVRLLSLIPKDSSILNTKFLYYCLQDKKYKIPKGGIPQLTIPMIKEYSIPIPCPETQEKIVKILDKLEARSNDLTRDLYTEIEARRKQYEFYRDKLLNFETLPV